MGQERSSEPEVFVKDCMTCNGWGRVLVGHWDQETARYLECEVCRSRERLDCGCIIRTSWGYNPYTYYERQCPIHQRLPRRFDTERHHAALVNNRVLELENQNLRKENARLHREIALLIDGT